MTFIWILKAPLWFQMFLLLLSLLPLFFSRWERSLVRISLVSFCDQETKPRSCYPELVSSTEPFWSQLIFIPLKIWWPKTSSSRKQAWTLLSVFYEVWTHLNGWPEDCNYWGYQQEAWLNLTNSLVCLGFVSHGLSCALKSNLCSHALFDMSRHFYMVLRVKFF